MDNTVTAVKGIKKESKLTSYSTMLKKDFSKNKLIYLMSLGGIIYYFIFHYIPIYGSLIAFKNFSPAKGIMGSPWVGFLQFEKFFKSYYFFRLLKNTVLINLYELIWGFPAPIILALLLNEVRSKYFKRTVQTVTYLPHFISSMVICGIIVNFCSKDGLINTIIVLFGGERNNLLMNPGLFRTIYVSSEIWQGVGWGSIIYLAALTGIDTQLYEAAIIDGANKWKLALHVTIPGIMPTIVIMLILRMGKMMSVGWDKIVLLYNPGIYETADVISTFVYRKGILESNFSYSAAVGLFNSVINLIMLVFANKISRKVNETSLW